MWSEECGEAGGDVGGGHPQTRCLKQSTGTKAPEEDNTILINASHTAPSGLRNQPHAEPYSPADPIQTALSTL